ncbi:MAG: hypothetical protein AAF478_02150 [Pseudomonadota bacterium]
MQFNVPLEKFGYLDRTGFDSDESYNRALIELASEISIRPPTVDVAADRSNYRKYWTVSFANSDKENWRNVLQFVVDQSNERVRKILVERFDRILSVAELERKYMIEDLDTSISNALNDYEFQTSSRLEFLSEQASIARTLGVAKSTLDIQTFATQNSVVANVNSEPPFYLRGFEAIEKEAELIQSRDNKRAFVNGLKELEQQKRGIEQNQLIERARSLMNLTSAMTGDGFKAADVLVDATDYNYRFKPLLIIAMALLLGLFAGAMFAIFRGMFAERERTVSAG